MTAPVEQDILEVISRVVKLTAEGNNFLGLCPFHEEKTPSFTVSQLNQSFHCFGCGAHGSATEFSRQYADLVAPVEQGVPNGCKSVPNEPTFEMIRAGKNCDGRSTGKNMESPRLIYLAMLAAAPAASLVAAAEGQHGEWLPEPSYADLELMYSEQCKLTDEFSEKARNAGDPALKARIAELEGHLATVNERLTTANLTPIPQQDKQDALLAICRAFIDKQEIGCAETIHQTDRVIEGAYAFITDICEAVGYFDDGDSLAAKGAAK